MFPLSTSYRELPPGETFARARAFGRALGVVRVADITRLDVVGIPVFASIRPSGHPRSLCVHAGKGLTPDDARTGALMEAIEFAVVESPRAPLTQVEQSPRETFGGDFRERMLDFCPAYGVGIPADAPLLWAVLHDLCSGTPVPVPLDLVRFPLPVEENYRAYFGASTNGLASGNSVDEASVHALLEVIERDVESFRLAADRSILIRNDSLPEGVREVVADVERTGLRVVCRYSPNEYGIPHFVAYILEQWRGAAVFACDGFGCHPDPRVALVRAVAEAAQSRLSHIHGGRDDIVERFELFASAPPSAEAAHNQRFEERVTRAYGEMVFDSVPGLPLLGNSSSETLRALLVLLAGRGVGKVARAVLTAPEDPVAVVRVVVPTLESLNRITRRVGRRLARYVERHRR